MYKAEHTVLIDNEMTALADDFRGLGEFVDVCNEHNVHVGVGVKENLLTIYTEEASLETVESIVKTVAARVPVFAEIEEV